ncbi:membrane or secreted protein [Candidatus Omnitrophus magneticus]|uniref:Membrane or secreted protein n=1 Tax=Candidatus Omnitrophus magneticus TaxID=1609969 RepID=A0A0F0CWL0_9BACT|nr:membrane or secreted protein [Candidatus Omnitrophus magneticus]
MWKLKPQKYILSNKAFSLTEILFASVLSVMAVGIILSVWIFAHKTWTGETYHTSMRIDMLKALETLENDIRLSSATYMVFYPADDPKSSAVLMPKAETDDDGFFPTEESGEIEWTQTIIYHIVEEDGEKKLRRSVLNSFDKSLNRSQREELLKGIVEGSESADDYSDLIKNNLDVFDISSLSAVVDFYDDSDSSILERNVVFGYSQLSPGDHNIRFTVTGKNQDSSGYGFGIDNLKIVPAASTRETEYYISSFAPLGTVVSSGDTTSIVHDSIWGNNGYLEYDANHIGDYIEFKDWYDLWRESSFDNTIKNNVVSYGNDVRIKLETTDDRDEQKFACWSGFIQTNDEIKEGRDGFLPRESGKSIVIRDIIKNEYIDEDVDMIRVSIIAPKENPIFIKSVYITRKEDYSSLASRYDNPDGLVNTSTLGKLTEEYHCHQQLFFKDIFDGNNNGDTDEVLESVWLASGKEIWSEWIAFPIRKTIKNNIFPPDYFITFYVPAPEFVSFPVSFGTFDSSKGDAKYWEDNTDQSIYIKTGTYTTAGTPFWTGAGITSGEYTSSNQLFFIKEIDGWQNKGTIESQVFDTSIVSPVYNNISWSQNKPAGTGITLKARSASNVDMSDAAVWDNILPISITPSSLSISNKRYAQFFAELSAAPFWTCPEHSLNISYVNYIEKQISFGGNKSYIFPTHTDFGGACGVPLVSGVYSSWVDDVAITWTAPSRICALEGDIAKRNDFGEVKITIDGNDLIKVLKVDVGLSFNFHGRIISEENSIEVEPKNTGK